MRRAKAKFREHPTSNGHSFARGRRYDLDRLPENDPKLWTRAAEILRELPEAFVGVGPQPTAAAEEAEMAERRAQGEQTEPATPNR